MRNFLLSLLCIGWFSITIAQSERKDSLKAQKAEIKPDAKRDHICTSACRNGKHVYVEGEKGYKRPRTSPNTNGIR